MKTSKPTKHAQEIFKYFCQFGKSLSPDIPPCKFDPDGPSALEWFHAYETHGKRLSTCQDPVLLALAIAGKKSHGINVKMLAEDYIGRILFANELKSNYPQFVRSEVLSLAAKLANEQFGYVPTFVQTGEDFTTLPKS